MFLLALFVTVEIILRAAGVATFGFLEIIILIMAAYVFIGLAFTQSTKGHIWLDTLTSRLPQKAQGILSSLALFLGLGFSTLFTWRLVIHTYSLWDKGTYYRGMVLLPWWPAYVVACLGFIFFVIILIAHFAQSVKQNVDNFRR